jgi:hypothetical protein
VSPEGGSERAQVIVDVLVDAFAELMRADADAFRTKFRKMADARGSLERRADVARVDPG